MALQQDGLERLPFLEGLSPLVSRLPAREAAALAAHLRKEAAALNLSDTHRESHVILLLCLPVKRCRAL